MTIYSFWIFDRHCNCIFSRDYSAPAAKHSISDGEIPKVDDDQSKLLFGALFSLRNMARKLGQNDDSHENQLNSFATARYRAHFFESASGLKFCLTTDLNTQHLQNVLKFIYSNLFVKFIARNPLSPIDFDEQTKITSVKFINSLDSYLKSAVI